MAKNEPTYTRANGEKIAISRMRIEHLENATAKLKRRAWDLFEKGDLHQPPLTDDVVAELFPEYTYMQSEINRRLNGLRRLK